MFNCEIGMLAAQFDFGLEWINAIGLVQKSVQELDGLGFERLALQRKYDSKSRFILLHANDDNLNLARSVSARLPFPAFRSARVTLHAGVVFCYKSRKMVV